MRSTSVQTGPKSCHPWFWFLILPCSSRPRYHTEFFITGLSNSSLIGSWDPLVEKDYHDYLRQLRWVQCKSMTWNVHLGILAGCCSSGGNQILYIEFSVGYEATQRQLRSFVLMLSNIALRYIQKRQYPQLAYQWCHCNGIHTNNTRLLYRKLRNGPRLFEMLGILFNFPHSRHDSSSLVYCSASRFACHPCHKVIPWSETTIKASLPARSQTNVLNWKPVRLSKDKFSKGVHWVGQDIWQCVVYRDVQRLLYLQRGNQVDYFLQEHSGLES